MPYTHYLPPQILLDWFVKNLTKNPRFPNQIIDVISLMVPIDKTAIEKWYSGIIFNCLKYAGFNEPLS